MAKKDRFGSPYDPNNKMPHPKGQDSNHEFSATEKIERLDYIDFSRPSFLDMARIERMREEMRNMFDIPDDVMRGLRDEMPTATFRKIGQSSFNVKTPPATYTAARNEVKEWIVAFPEQTFDDIVGNDDALRQLRDAIQAPVHHKELFEAYGLKMPKGALLAGPPGCGKTMFARAAAAEMRRLYGETTEFLSLSASSVRNPWFGKTEENIRNLFAFAREYKAYHGHPLLIFIDEAESLLPDRNSPHISQLAESIVSTFLAEMDGLQESGAFVMLATNRPEVMDEAATRDGRCDFKITVKRPTREAIEVIIRRTFANARVADGLSTDALVFAAVESIYDPHKVLIEAHMVGLDLETMKTHNLADRHFLFEHIISGAMAASVYQRAARYAFDRDKAAGKARGIITDDVLNAVRDLFDENKGRQHSFSFNEFRQSLHEAAVEAAKGIQAAKTAPKKGDMN